MAVTRRFFVKSGGIALVGLGGGLCHIPGFLGRAIAGSEAPRKTLVVVFQRGAADGLNIVVPHGEKAYYDARPTIAIPRPKAGDAATALDLDGFFGFHPVLAPLKQLYDDKLLAVVQAVGSPDSTRSHFDAQDFMESGTPGEKSTTDGWLNRYLQHNPDVPASSFRALAMTTRLPRILRGSATALAIPRLDEFGIEQRYGRWMERGLKSVYASSTDELIGGTAQDTFDAVDFLEKAKPTHYKPRAGVEYPKGKFGSTMMQVAQLIKAEVGLEIAFVEAGGWDHHINEGGVRGTLARMLDPFAQGIAAFTRDLGSRMDDCVVLTLSEFGRTVHENGNRGTDHGHATTAFVVGGPVRGGQIYGSWPGLKPEQRFEGRDLAMTTDFRDLISEVLAGHLGAEQLEQVFPGHRVERERFLKVIAT